MAAGSMPTEVAPYFCGANLFAAKKKDGGLRPVAVGETLHRLTSKCLAFKVANEAAAFLTPLQFGVGVRWGCEAFVHATRATLQDSSIPLESCYCLLVDFENSFNQGDRVKILEEVREHFPQLSKWVETCYGQHSFLNLGGQGPDQ